jgi:hypothetical protein
VDGLALKEFQSAIRGEAAVTILCRKNFLLEYEKEDKKNIEEDRICHNKNFTGFHPVFFIAGVISEMERSFNKLGNDSEANKIYLH